MKKLMDSDFMELDTTDFQDSLDPENLGTRYLALDRFPSWMMDDSPFIYERKSYCDLYEKIWSEEYKDMGVIVVTGSPGIGKSVFAVYIMYEALKKGMKVVVISNRSGMCYIYHPDESVKCCSSIVVSPSLISVLQEKNTLLLVDAATKKSSALPFELCRTIFFSAPSSENLADYEKLSKEVTFHMPVWSLKETLCAHSIYMRLGKDQDLNVIRDRYFTIGGTARFVFGEDVKYKKHLAMTEKAASQTSLSTIRSAKTWDSSKDSHKIFVQEVSGDYSEGTLTFCSKYIQRKVYYCVEANERAEMIKFLRKPKSNDGLSAFRGAIFEEEAHRLLANGGEFKTRELSCDLKEEGFIKLPKSDTFVFSNVNEIAFHLEEFLVPKSCIFESIDSLTARHPDPPCRFAAFQCTVSDKHPIKVEGMETILEALKNLNRPDIYHHKFRLYFVVPQCRFAEFTKKQTYVTLKDTDFTNVPKNVSSIEQYSLCIEL
jgi:hypothetical protein